MEKYIVSLLSVILLCSCNPTAKPKAMQPTVKTFTDIYIIPLDSIDSQAIEIVSKGIEAFYGIVPKVENSVALTTDLLAKSGTRYDGNKILDKFKSNRYQLFITEKDIAIKYPPRHSDEWGIIGLSYSPGRTAVVSTFRIKRNSKLFSIRLQKVCNHELGHCLGLKHCNASPICLMNDANGTMKQIDKEEMKFCETCLSKIKRL